MASSSWELVESLVYVQGTLLVLILGLGWTWVGLTRKWERLRREAHKGAVKKHESPPDASPGASDNDEGSQPMVSVIMPVKGCREHSQANWASHVGMKYGGPLEFIFVGECQDDPAWPPLKTIAAQHLAQQDQQQDTNHCPSDHECSQGSMRTVRLHVAGRSHTCSQKIHNLASAALASSPRARYLLFLDDDVECHPSTLHDLVRLLECDPSLFMATGYPFDVPAKAAGLPAYCIAVCHLALLIPVSLKQRTTFVWGGCMLLRADSLRPNDPHGILKAWLDGGYSDDLIIAAQCVAQKLTVAAPRFAIFPQRLDARVTWGQYWNYFRRQLFVLDTYADSANRIVNYSMMVIASYFCSIFCAALACVLLRTSQLMLQGAAHWLQDSGTDASHHLPWATPNSSPFYSSNGGNFNAGPLAAACLLPLALIFAHCALRYMTGQVLQLLALLSPSRPPISASTFQLSRVWVGLAVQCLLMPLCMVYTLAQPAVVWSGTRYFKAHGKVARIERGSFRDHDEHT